MKPYATLDEIGESFEPGETVFIAGSSGEPCGLTQLLVDQPARAHGVRFITSFVPGVNSRNLAPAGGARRMQVFFMQSGYRSAYADGRIDVLPMNYYGVQQFLQSASGRADIAVVQVSEPDSAGWCSLGPAVEFAPAVLRCAGRSIAIVNSCTPRIPGSPRLHIDSFSRVARAAAPLSCYDPGTPNRVADAIAAHLAALVPSGATVQIGLGKVPNQFARALREHRDIAFHSGMLSDAAFELSGSRCLRKHDPFVTAVVVGGERLYGRLPHFDGLRLEPIEYTHDPQILARVERLYAINSAIEVDLTGQVNAEVLNGACIGGPGGAPDFAAAAHRQPDGLSVIALPATDPSGRRSRIVAALEVGAPIAISRHDVDAVVTEYGVAMLRGKDAAARMNALVSVAHPDYREDLRCAARRAERSYGTV